MFNWNNYIQLADELMTRKTDSLTDASIRSAVSRMYYGVFCLTREFLKKKKIHIPTSGKAHSTVRDELFKINSQDSIKLAKLLSDLHTQRKNADYESALTISKNQAVLIDYKKRKALKYLSQL